MSIFNPDVSSEVRPEQGVTFNPTGSTLSAISNLTNAALSTRSTREPSAREVDAGLITAASERIQKLEPLRKSNPKAYRKGLREVQINFMRNGGNVDQLDELILTQTGQQSDVAMFDAEERDFMAFLADEETARTYYAAAVYESELNNLGLSPSQLEEQAYKQYLLEQSISTITATNQQQFDTFDFPGKRAAFMTEVKAETAMFLRNPTDYGSGDVQTALALKLEEIDTLKTQALEVAPNIDLSKYDQLKEEVKLAYGVIENAVTAPLDEKLKKRVVQKVTNLVDQGKITDVQGILVTQALGDPRILEIILAQEGEGSPIQDLVDAIKMLGVSEIPPEAQTEGSEGEGQVPTSQITSHVNGKAEARGEGENIALVGPYSTANKLNKLVHTEPDSVRVWGGMMADRNAALIYLGSGGNYWTDRTYGRSFNTNYFKNLENLKSADPELYEVVRAQTLEAIDQSIITLTNTIEDNELFVVNPDGTVSVSDGFEEDLAKFLGNPYSPKMPNVKESMPTVMRGIREAYGVVDGKPDLLSALADPTASKIHALGAGYKPQDKAYIANFIRHARGMSSIFKDTRPEALREALGSMDFLRKLRARLTGAEPGGNFAAQAIQPENRGFGRSGAGSMTTTQLPPPVQSPPVNPRPEVANSLPKINPDFIESVEGNESSMYVPNKRGEVIGNSGPTIGAGVDLGQRNFEDLNGLPTDLIEKLKPYLGLKRQEALDFVKSNPLTLSDEEITTINQWAKRKETEKLIENWNRDSDVPFESLTPEQATVVASVLYQYGSPSRVPRFWKYATNGQWKLVEKELRAFGDNFQSRRTREANYLVTGKF